MVTSGEWFEQLKKVFQKWINARYDTCSRMQVSATSEWLAFRDGNPYPFWQEK